MTPRLLRNVKRSDLVPLIASVLLLGSLAIPGFSGYIERSRVARAVSDIGTLSLQLYRFQHDTNALPASLAEAGLGGDDPWGRPYVYRRAAGARVAELRKDGELLPLNSDFDLYSLGPDGESALSLPAEPSRDDVVRAANGAYIGLAVNY